MIVLFKKEDLEKSGDFINLGVPVMEKLEILKLSAEVAEKEAHASWRRYSMMLYASIGLLLVLLLTLKVAKFWTISIPALIGILISFAWLRINALSSRNAERWQADMASTIESDKTLQGWVNEKGLPVNSGPFSDKKAQFYFNLLPHAFLGLWAFIFLAAISSGSWRATPDSGNDQASKESPANVEERVLVQESERGPKSADMQVASESSSMDTSQGGQVYVDSRSSAKRTKDQAANEGARQEATPEPGMTVRSQRTQVYVDSRTLTQKPKPQTGKKQIQGKQAKSEAKRTGRTPKSRQKHAGESP